MVQAVPEIIDGDGHIYERDDAIQPYLDSEYQYEGLRNFYFFPTLDGWMRSAQGGPSGRTQPYPDAADWVKFMDDAGISQAVLYPTAGLGYGFIKDKTWATVLARGYNNFMYDRFLKQSPRLKAVALIPVQDPPAAAAELRRAVEELGMVGAVLPAVGLRRPYGDAAFDGLYETAQALDTMLAMHGAPQQGLGFDFFEEFLPGQILEHPFSQMIQFTNMVFERVFARFPRLKVAFLEAGCGWAPYLIERIDDRTGGLASEQVRNHPIYFNAELDEDILRYAVAAIGDDRFIYASDYPHEGIDAGRARRTLQSFLAREDLSQTTKQKVLCDNIKALYGIK